MTSTGKRPQTVKLLENREALLNALLRIPREKAGRRRGGGRRIAGGHDAWSCGTGRANEGERSWGRDRITEDTYGMDRLNLNVDSDLEFWTGEFRSLKSIKISNAVGFLKTTSVNWFWFSHLKFYSRILIGGLIGSVTILESTLSLTSPLLTYTCTDRTIRRYVWYPGAQAIRNRSQSREQLPCTWRNRIGVSTIQHLALVAW